MYVKIDRLPDSIRYENAFRNLTPSSRQMVYGIMLETEKDGRGSELLSLMKSCMEKVLGI